MADVKSYKVDGKVLDIPLNEVDGFLKAVPNAQEVQSFLVGKDTLDIPIHELDGFKKAIPNAKPLFQSAPQPIQNPDVFTQGFTNPQQAQQFVESHRAMPSVTQQPKRTSGDVFSSEEPTIEENRGSILNEQKRIQDEQQSIIQKKIQQYDISKHELEKSFGVNHAEIDMYKPLLDKINKGEATDEDKKSFNEIVLPKIQAEQKKNDLGFKNYGYTNLRETEHDATIADNVSKIKEAIANNQPYGKYLDAIHKILPNYNLDVEQINNPKIEERNISLYQNSIAALEAAQNNYNQARLKVLGNGLSPEVYSKTPLYNYLPEYKEYNQAEEELAQAKLNAKAAYRSAILKEDIGLKSKQDVDYENSWTGGIPLNRILKGGVLSLASYFKPLVDEKPIEPFANTQTEMLARMQEGTEGGVQKNIEQNRHGYTEPITEGTGKAAAMMFQQAPIAAVGGQLTSALGLTSTAESVGAIEQLMAAPNWTNKLLGAGLAGNVSGLEMMAATGNKDDYQTGFLLGGSGKIGQAILGEAPLASVFMRKILPKAAAENPYLNKIVTQTLGTQASVTAVQLKKYAEAAINSLKDDKSIEQSLQEVGIHADSKLKDYIIESGIFHALGITHLMKPMSIEEKNIFQQKLEKAGVPKVEAESMNVDTPTIPTTETKVEETINPTEQKVEVKTEQPDLKTALAELETEEKPTTPQVNEGLETLLNEPINNFVERIKKGEKMTSPEDLQFYDNNKSEIENLLKNEIVVEQPKVEVVNESTAPKLNEVVGKQLKYRGQEGTIVKDEGGKFEFHTPNMIVELGNENVPISDWGMKVTEKEEIPHNISLQDENNATINGNKYTINVDEKGNVISISPQNKPEQQIKNEKLITQVEIERNKLEYNPKELSIIAETPKEQYDNATKNINEQKVLEGVYLKNMTETISSAMDKLDSGEKLDEKEKIQTEQWVFDALDSVEKLMEENPNNPHYEQAHKTLQTINELLNESRSNDSETTIPQPTKKPQRRSAKKPTSIQGNESGSAEKQGEGSAAPESVGGETKGQGSEVTENAVNPLKDVESTAKALEGKNIKKPIVSKNGDEYEFDYNGTKAKVIYDGSPISDGVKEPEAYLDIINGNKKHDGAILISLIKDYFKDKGAKVMTLRPDEGLGYSGEGSLSKYYERNGFEFMRNKEYEGAMKYDLKNHKSDANKAISEAYHKAKADGSNPELVKAIEDLLTNKNEKVNEQPKTEVRQTLADALKETEGLRESSKKKARNKLIDKHFENIFAQLTLKEPNKIKRIC